MKFLGKVLSPRFWVLAILIVSMGNHFLPRYFQEIPIIMVLFILLGVAFLVFLRTALGAYEIESVKDFVKDIFFDVIYLIGSIIWFVSGLFLSADAVTLGVTGIAILLTLSDFALSLKGGADKLLEMDKNYFSHGRP